MFSLKWKAPLVVLLLLTGVISPAAAAKKEVPNRLFAGEEIPLWPGTAPGSGGLDLKQQVLERSTDPKVQDRAVTGITDPSIIPFFPPKGRANGAAVLIAPGGGYERVVIDKEGADIAEWLNSLGITAFVLKYRLPGEGHEVGYNVPLQDAQRAMRIIRQNADEWGIDAGKVGVMGFSAGGHLASTLATQYTAPVYDPVDGADGLDARPDFLVLGYPVISMKEGITHPGSRGKLLGADPSEELVERFSNELHVDANTPPAFIVQAHDDGVSTENSVLFYQALKAAKADAELHIFRTGGHGFGIRLAKGPVALWTKLCEEWLISEGMIGGRP